MHVRLMQGLVIAISVLNFIMDYNLTNEKFAKIEIIMTKPQPRTLPFTNAFSGGDHYEVRGVTEHYFPSKYQDISATVHTFEIEIQNFKEMIIKTRFRLDGASDAIKNLYTDESWKFRRTQDLLDRFPVQDEKLRTPAPLFALMLNKYLQVVDAKIHRATSMVNELVYDNDADMLVLPTSFPPLCDMPTDENYTYYDKKSVVFYSDIQLGVEYEAIIHLEANAGTFEFAPLFPYGTVNIEKFKMTDSSEYEIQCVGWKVPPTTSKEFPDWFQYQLDRLGKFEPEMRPHFRPALPYRGTFPLFNLAEEFILTSGDLSEREVFKKIMETEVDLSGEITLHDYETIRFGFSITIPLNKNIDVIVKTIKRPLPPRLYEQMQKLPNFRDALVEYTVFNLSHEKLRLRVETEILGYTEKEMKVIFLHGINNKKNQKAQLNLTQCPRLKKDVLEQLTIPANATMVCKVTNEDTKEVLFEESFPVDILANDEMVWELNDLRSNHKYHLHDFICAWITPTDRNGLMDKVRSEARSYHPDNTLGHKLETLGDVRLHVKAVYDYLASQGINYLNQPISSLNSTTGQRVVLPERVLQNKAGNCIDLTVLFASILEGLGLYSLIFLTPNHAFIGWGNKHNHKEIIFLETTLLGASDFDTAMAQGRKNFEDNFLLIDGKDGMFIPDIQRMKGMVMVDTLKARHSGQVSARHG